MAIEVIKQEDIGELNRLKDIVNEYDILSDRYVRTINNICEVLNKANENYEGVKVLIED